MESRVKNAAESFVEGAENFVEGAMNETPKEGSIARKLESATSQLPSDVWLWASVGSMLLSLGLQLSGNKKTKSVSQTTSQKCLRRHRLRDRNRDPTSVFNDARLIFNIHLPLVSRQVKQHPI